MRTRLGLLLAGLIVLSCAKKDYTRLYRTEDRAPSLTDADIAALEHMGPTLVDRGVNFATYSERAERIELLLFSDPESNLPTKRFPMVRFGNVWNLYVEGVGVGQHYGFVAWGPNWNYDEAWFCGSIDGFQADVDAAGNRFNPNKLLFDPWGKAMHRDHDWSRASLASGPKRTECTWGAGVKSVVIDSQYAWSANEATWRANRESADFPGHNWNDTIVYEVHVKGFTKEAASGVDHPGTYRGLGEKAAYLADLGITAVELLPIHEKPQDGGYWGYWNLSYFAPENTYASTTEPREIVDEFKWMVDQLHQNGIEVILDVVYNHTGEGGLWRERQYTNDVSVDPGSYSHIEPKEVAGIYSYRGLDNVAFYALNADNQTFWNNTGVGHQTRPNHVPTRRLIMDSLHYYVEEMHVDGFRFDLAGILGEQDGNYNFWDDPANTVLQEIIDDPLLQQYNTRIIAEPWTAGGSYGALIGAYPVSATKPGTGWGEWNAHFRDWWRSIANNDSYELNSTEGPSDGGSVITGSQVNYGWNGRRPYHAVNFITSHDGFTMFDLFSYEQKKNGCSPLNPVCCENPASPWCEIDHGESNNRSRAWVPDDPGTVGVDERQRDDPFKRQQMRNMFTALLISHGTPMLLGGDEWMRTQLGNNNAYSSGADNEYNWFRWGEWIASDEKHRMHDFVRKAIALRKTHAYAFAPAAYGASAPFAWKDVDNTDMTGGDWDTRRVMIHFYDETVGPELAVLINFQRTPVTFTLPVPPAGHVWARRVDTQAYFEDPANTGLDPRESGNADVSATPATVTTGDYGVQGTSIVILEAVP